MNHTLTHHGILGQKWGVRRFQNKDGTRTAAGKQRYSISEKIASKMYEKASKIEPQITSDVRESIENSGASIYGLDHRLKTQESISRKITTDSKEKKMSINEAAKRINDSLRYTSISDDNSFVAVYNSVKSSLLKKGYTEEKCKNYFNLYRQGKAKHKQITSVFSDNDGNLFEIQFQTPSSIKAKELKTPLYEEVRQLGVSEKRKAELMKLMEDLAESVNDPEGVYKIISHSDYCLTHHGILGQKWGIRRFQPYPSGERKRKFVGEKTEKKSASGDEEQPGRKGLTDGQKRVIKIGAAVVATALVAYGGYKLYDSGKLNPVIDKFSKKGENSVRSIDKLNVNGIQTNNATTHKDALPKSSKLYDILDNKNPTGDTDNCKDLAATAACRAFGKDVVAGHKTTDGGLTELFEDKFGISNKVIPIHTNQNESTDDIRQKTINQILRRYKEGDVGCISIGYSEEVRKLTGFEAHAFNWTIENGSVTFGDSQSGYPKNGEVFFKYLGPGKDVEIVGVTEEMAEKIASYYST